MQEKQILIDYLSQNGFSYEKGEDYCVVSATCDICSSEYETTEWGEWENLEAAKEVLQDYISKIIKSN